jgi:outer membrane scaffolding protein for murein synthesis (MipA/OmpV family)
MRLKHVPGRLGRSSRRLRRDNRLDEASRCANSLHCAGSALEVPFLPSASGDRTMIVGVGAEYKPNFEGAKGGSFGPVPIFSIHRAGAAERFHGPRDAASIASAIY